MGLVVLAALVGADVVLAPSSVVTGPFLMAPFVCALFAGPRRTALVAGLAILLGASSPLWQVDGGTAYVIRLAAIVAAGAFAVAGAHARERWRANADRLRLLDAISEFADGSLPLARDLEPSDRADRPRGRRHVHDRRGPRGPSGARRGSRAGSARRCRGRGPAAATARHRFRARFVTSEPAWTHIAHFRPRMDAEDLRRMAADPEDLAFLKSLRPRSSIVAAMTARGRALGTLTLVTAWSKRRYTAADVNFAQVLARRIGLALDSAGLFSDLESVERRLDTVMSMLNEAIVVHDAGGDLVYANHAAARWLGFTSPREVVEAAEHELMSRFEIWTEHRTRLDRDLIAQRFRAGRLPRREQVRLALKSSGRGALGGGQLGADPRPRRKPPVHGDHDRGRDRAEALRVRPAAARALRRAAGRFDRLRAHGAGRSAGGGPAVRRLVLGPDPGSERGPATGRRRAPRSGQGRLGGAGRRALSRAHGRRSRG